MTAILLIVLFIYIALQLFRYALDYLNMRYVRIHGATLPPDFAGIADEAVLERAQAYLIDKTRFDIIASSFSSLATVIFLFAGILDLYNSWVSSLGLPFVAAGWLFFLILYLVDELLSIPFSLYFTFSIENKYGFNRMTYRLWIADFLKSTVLSVVLLSIVVLAGLWLVSWSVRFWWFWVWCFSLAFSLFITYVSPYVIAPLFNKFTPLEDADLREGVVLLASKAGIKVSKVLKMDESKRSRHTNAYFTGIGRTKRIVLFDTLLESMNRDEILAVLAHEIGHWKRWHLLKGLVLIQAFSLVILFLAFQGLSSDFLSTLFGIREDTFFAKAVVVAFLAGMLSFLLKPLLGGFSRRLEREADRFSCDIEGRGESMISALVKLSKENLSNLCPHPLYALFHYTHPPVLQRIQEIREYCERRHSRSYD